MIILGDIGNTETKICLVNNNKIIKKIVIPSKGKKIDILNKYFKRFKFIKVKKILFCSVVPSTFKDLKNYFRSIYPIVYDIEHIRRMQSMWYVK